MNDFFLKPLDEKDLKEVSLDEARESLMKIAKDNGKKKENDKNKKVEKP